MFFSKKRVFILGLDVDVVDEFKDLGKHIKNRLNWEINTRLCTRWDEQAISPKQAEILQCVQKNDGDFPSLRGDERRVHCCVVQLETG